MASKKTVQKGFLGITVILAFGAGYLQYQDYLLEQIPTPTTPTSVTKSNASDNIESTPQSTKKVIMQDGEPVLQITKIPPQEWRAPVFQDLESAALILAQAINGNEAASWLYEVNSSRLTKIRVANSNSKLQIAENLLKLEKSQKERQLVTREETVKTPKLNIIDATYVDNNEFPRNITSSFNSSTAISVANTPDTPKPQLALKGITSGRITLSMGGNFLADAVIGQVAFNRYKITNVDISKKQATVLDQRTHKPITLFYGH
ncbi:hypothetical protein UA38_11590 [Photobacterium kishitanii]|uniref:Uncharacterized protein n=1 Tax=Photobacterium kishitanii TaxID=318456 RepID=A0AAX0YSX4_9GAMM|nr:hypothetical protein [Photobacterium kishitanii]KJG57014.1 hypothetical protein UA38_11590 [Photobacterium kishitanii]KJG60537.1 hypothetical protein UA42_14370 [Photobacterium kishitanii]KJG64837.1 hypothetical protein UA40_14055 [Photobacterium kishitanii]KJG68475.1 hypothetical protein UA41_16475 [Photobacterium kishitanii]PSX18371.1 hypothetical protein C0W70_16000 [Photobacterium kishitanii]